MIGVFSFLSFLSACSTYYYYPTFQNVPAHTNSNEISGAYFISGENEGFTLNYSVTNHFGAFLTANTFDGYNFRDGTQLFDFGLYAFDSKPINTNGNINFIYAVSAAYGYGEYNREKEFYNLNISRLSIQPSIALTSKIFDCGLSFRLSNVDYELHRFAYNSEYDENLMNIGKDKFYFFEPHAFIGLGYKGIKLNYHTLITKKINAPKILYYETPTGYFSLSLKYTLGKPLFK